MDNVINIDVEKLELNLAKLIAEGEVYRRRMKALEASILALKEMIADINSSEEWMMPTIAKATNHLVRL